CGPREVWFWWCTNGVKPSADVHLRVGFSAEMACSGGIRGLRVPFVHRELRIAALDDEPMNGIAGYRSADFTSEFLQGCHLRVVTTQNCLTTERSQIVTLSRGRRGLRDRRTYPWS